MLTTFNHTLINSVSSAFGHVILNRQDWSLLRKCSLTCTGFPYTWGDSIYAPTQFLWQSFLQMMWMVHVHSSKFFPPLSRIDAVTLSISDRAPLTPDKSANFCTNTFYSTLEYINLSDYNRINVQVNQVFDIVSMSTNYYLCSISDFCCTHNKDNHLHRVSVVPFLYYHLQILKHCIWTLW